MTCNGKCPLLLRCLAQEVKGVLCYVCRTCGEKIIHVDHIPWGLEVFITKPEDKIVIDNSCPKVEKNILYYCDTCRYFNYPYFEHWKEKGTKE